MKAIIKETGETVEVFRIETIRTEGVLKGAHQICYPEELEFPCIEDEQWEQRRFELAKSAMQGILSEERVVDYACSEADYKKGEKHTIPKSIALFAISCADAMIKQMKGEK